MIKRGLTVYLFSLVVLVVVCPLGHLQQTRCPPKYNEGPPAKGTTLPPILGREQCGATMLKPFSAMLRTGGQNPGRIAPATMLLLLRPWHGAQ